MIGLSNTSQNGIKLTEFKEAHSDFFIESVIKDNLVRQYIPLHPYCVDASNTNVCNDLTKSNVPLNLFNSPTWDGYSYSFNGINQFANYSWPFSTVDNSSLTFSVDFWVKLGAPADIYVIANNNPGGYIRMLYTGSGRYILFFLQTSAGIMQATSQFIPYTVGDVEHISCVRYYDTLYIYRNGQPLQITSSSNLNSTPVTLPLNYIGRYVSNYMTGNLLYFALYSKALTPQEVLFNYSNNKSRFN